MAEFEEILTKRLVVEMRLLHHMTAKIFLPKVGRFDFVIKRDVTIMHHTIHEIPFNLPSTIIKVMQESASPAKPSLPYGTFFTLIFKEFGINFNGEPSRKLQHFDTYDDKLLRRMGYIKADGQWIRKRGQREEAEEDRQRKMRARGATGTLHFYGSVCSVCRLYPNIPFI